MSKTINARTMQFGPISVRYDDRVLTPRTWTLLQSQWAAEIAANSSDGPLLELCAGAGHIGLAAAVLCDRPLVQVELTEAGAAFARANADAAGRGEQVDVRQAPMQSALRDDETFAVVLADPPYLPTAQISRWPEDPVLAIDGGADGLDLVRMCLQVAADHLRVGGTLLLQVAGAEQADAIVAWLARQELRLRYEDTRSHDDERAVMRFTAT